MLDITSDGTNNINIEVYNGDIEIIGFKEGKMSNSSTSFSDNILYDNDVNDSYRTEHGMYILGNINHYNFHQNDLSSGKVKLYLPSNKYNINLFVKNHRGYTIIKDMTFSNLYVKTKGLNFDNVRGLWSNITITEGDKYSIIKNSDIDGQIITVSNLDVLNSSINQLDYRFAPSSINISDSKIMEKLYLKSTSGRVDNTFINDLFIDISSLLLEHCAIGNVDGHNNSNLKLNKCTYQENSKILCKDSIVFINNDDEKYSMNQKSLKKVLIYDKNTKQKKTTIKTKGKTGAIVDDKRIRDY